MQLPPPVRGGARVGVAALSAPVAPERLERGLDTLRELGFEPVTAANLGLTSGLFAGSDGDRLEAFHRLAADPRLEAIFFARGGHGLLRLLPSIDWELLARHPRCYLGYSDLTPLLNEIPRRLGLATFHGPMVAADMARGLTDGEREALLGALAGELPRHLPVTVRAGRGVIEGPLRGGCLSLLAATTGTAWAIDLREAILFWEDVGEPAYRLDRMLTHLELSGSLNSVRGMVVGYASAVAGEGGEGAFERTLVEFAEERGWPLAIDCPSGHGAPNLTLPLGLTARLDVEAGELIIG